MAKVENEKICAILAWIFPIGLIWYFVDEKMHKSKLAKHHVKQSLVLFLAAIAANVVMAILFFISWIIAPFVYLAFLIFWIIGLVYAIQEQTKELPLIGQFASVFKF